MVWDDDRMHLSASQLSAFSRCGMQYKLIKIDKLPNPPSAALLKGNAVHDVLEEWERKHRDIDLEVAYGRAWQYQLDKATAEYPDMTQWPHDRRTKDATSDLKYRHRDGLQEIINYTRRATDEAEMWHPLQLPNGELAIEVPFSISYGDFVVNGRVDVVQEWNHDGSVTVADYKTGSASGENYRQLGTYRVGLQEAHGITVNFGRYWYTQATRDSPAGRASDWVDLRRYTREYVGKQYRLLKTARAHDIYIPNPSNTLCGSCSVRQYCPEMKDN